MQPFKVASLGVLAGAVVALGASCGSTDRSRPRAPEAAAGENTNAEAGTAGAEASNEAGASPSMRGQGGHESAGAGGSAGSASTGGRTAGGAGGADAGGSGADAGGSGADAGSGGNAGMSGSAGSGPTPTYDVPRGPSTGCSKAAAPDVSDDYTLHVIDIPNAAVDATYVANNPPAALVAPYTWTHRNYYLRLPSNYDETKPYPLVLQAPACGNTSGVSGRNGGLATLPAGQSEVIQVGLSYMYSNGPCFADNTAQTPEPAYFDAVLKDVEARLCVDKGRVFGAGWSTGANETGLFGCARAGAIRAIGMAGGTARTDRPACTTIPEAAMFVVGENDQMTPPAGLAKVRDDVLARNGCSGTNTSAWNASYPACVTYTGCPAAFPVVWCLLPGVGSTTGNVGGVNYSGEGFWKFWSSLPAVP